MINHGDNNQQQKYFFKIDSFFDNNDSNSNNISISIESRNSDKSFEEEMQMSFEQDKKCNNIKEKQLITHLVMMKVFGRIREGYILILVIRIYMKRIQ